MKSCSNCERRFKTERGKGCQAFTEKPKECWAWTDDPDWLRKVNRAVNNYQLTRSK